MMKHGCELVDMLMDGDGMMRWRLNPSDAADRCFLTAEKLSDARVQIALYGRVVAMLAEAVECSPWAQSNTVEHDIPVDD